MALGVYIRNICMKYYMRYQIHRLFWLNLWKMRIHAKVCEQLVCATYFIGYFHSHQANLLLSMTFQVYVSVLIPRMCKRTVELLSKHATHKYVYHLFESTYTYKIPKAEE